MKPLTEKQRLGLSLEQRRKHDRRRNPEILREIKKLLDEWHNSLGELTDYQADTEINRLKKMMGFFL